MVKSVINEALVSRLTAVAANFMFYMVVARQVNADLSSDLFFSIALVVSLEMFICGALEPSLFQKRFSPGMYTWFWIRYFATNFLIIALVGAGVLAIAVVALWFTPLSRFAAVIGRVNGHRLSYWFDGAVVAVFNLIGYFCFVNALGVNLMMLPVLVAVINFCAVLILFRPKLKFYSNSDVLAGREYESDLAVYLQFSTSFIVTLSLQAVAGSSYKDVFLAQRWGDAMSNLSRVFQWSKVEEIAGGARVFSFSMHQKLQITLLVFIVIVGGTGFGLVSGLDSLYFYLLPLFIIIGLLSVMQANVSQVLIKLGLVRRLLAARSLQVLVLSGGVGAALLLENVYLILFGVMASLFVVWGVVREF